MPPDSEIIISDTSSLILLTKIGELDRLRKFGRPILCTPAIEREFKERLPAWINVVSPTHDRYQKILHFEIDEGEASAIALALEIDDSTIVIGDLK